MSAPQTNIETQKRRHRGPIIGIVLVVIFALVLLFVQMMYVAEDGTPVDNGAAQIDGRTGDTVPATDTTGPATPVPAP